MKTSITHLTYLWITTLHSIQANPITNSSQQTTHLIHQFPNESWIENIYIRSNGHILATNAARPQVLLVSPKNPSEAANPIVSFPTGTGIFGITEVEHDVFYVSSNVIDINTYAITANQSAIWEIDLRSHDSAVNSSQSVGFRKVANVTSAVLLNGLATLSVSDRVILAADGSAGVIYAIDVQTGESDIFLDDPLLKGHGGTGVNGIAIYNSTLYFTSTYLGILGKISISNRTGKAGGVARIVANVTSPDDLAVDERDGSIWVADDLEVGSVTRVSAGGIVERVIESKMDLFNGPTSLKFGRGVGAGERGVLYVGTNGAYGGFDGRILAVDVDVGR